MRFTYRRFNVERDERLAFVREITRSGGNARHVSQVFVRAVGALIETPEVPPALAGACLIAAPDAGLYVLDAQCPATEVGAALRALDRLPGMFRVELGPPSDAARLESAARDAGMPEPTLRGPVDAEHAAARPDRWLAGALTVECGPPSVVVIARTHGLGAHRDRVADALRGGRGFAGVGVFDIGMRDAIIIEIGDILRTPLHRVFAVLEIESTRFGGTLAASALVTPLPLAALLDTLAARMPLAVQPAHVLETHLTGGAIGAANASGR